MSTLEKREISPRLDVAVAAAREAGLSTLRWFQRSDLAFERKDDDSPVTAADRHAEQLLRDRILAAFPGDAILGEEGGMLEGGSGYRWILDPIDGTKSFICGVPLYSTLVAVEVEQRSVVGVIFIPALDECVYAASGQGAWYTKRGEPPAPAHVGSCAQLADGLFVTSQIDSFDLRGAMPVYRELERRSYIARTWGDGYGYLLVATGRAAVMVDPVMKLWDAAALQPILEEAGGAFTDWSGQPTIHRGEGVGCNRRLLDEVLEITRPYTGERPPTRFGL